MYPGVAYGYLECRAHISMSTSYFMENERRLEHTPPPPKKKKGQQASKKTHKSSHNH